MKDEDRRRLKKNLNKLKGFCVLCKKDVCYKHRKVDEKEVVKCVN